MYHYPTRSVLGMKVAIPFLEIADVEQREYRPRSGMDDPPSNELLLRTNKRLGLFIHHTSFGIYMCLVGQWWAYPIYIPADSLVWFL